MAYMCTHGLNKECDGCGECEKEPKERFFDDEDLEEREDYFNGSK